MCASDWTRSIQTPRLRLRKPRPSDVERIAALCSDFDIVRMTSRMPWPYGVEEARAFIEHTATRDPAVENIFLIDHPDHGAIGAVGLDIAGTLPELGYWIGREHWGQGYATEAAKGALVWASTAWGKRVVTAGHFADNPASAAVLAKAGFLYTGEVQSRASLARGEDAPTRMMVWLA